MCTSVVCLPDPGSGDTGLGLIDPGIDPTFNLLMDPSIAPVDNSCSSVVCLSTPGTNTPDQVLNTSNQGLDCINPLDLSNLMFVGGCDTIGTDPVPNSDGTCTDPLTGIIVVCPGGTLGSDGGVGATPGSNNGASSPSSCVPTNSINAVGPLPNGQFLCPTASAAGSGGSDTSGSAAAGTGAIGALGTFLGSFLKGIGLTSPYGSGVVPACGQGFSTTGLCRGTNGTLYQRNAAGQLVPVTGNSAFGGLNITSLLPIALIAVLAIAFLKKKGV